MTQLKASFVHLIRLLLEGRLLTMAIMTRTAAVVDAEKKPKLLDQLQQAIRTKHYSIRTEQAYCDWVRRFILFHGKRCQ
jgi:Phage integrase, N-terminal SAM-like domain